jgi:hypothetical protein
MGTTLLFSHVLRRPDNTEAFSQTRHLEFSMKNIFKSTAILFACATALIIGQAAKADTIVYQNTNTTSTHRFNPGTVEVGDEINLGPGPRLLTTFEFEYWTQNFTFGSQTMKFTLYNNNGSPDINGFATPGTQIYSETFALNPSFWTYKGNMIFDLTSQNIILPNTFTWAVQFSGLQAGESAGVDLTDTAPTIGSGHTDYWDNNGGWTMKTNTDGSAINFAAQISTVPEPSAVAFAALGVLSLLAFGLRRSS